MFNISKNGNVTVTRGDSFSIDVFVNVGTALAPAQYILSDGDVLYFGLMEPHQPFEFALIRKVFTSENNTEDGLVRMEFEPEMTEYLMPGTYYYMVKLKTGDDEVSTVISKTKFIVLD